MIWCSNNPNVHTRTFCKCLSFTRRCFFPLSILKENHRAGIPEKRDSGPRTLLGPRILWWPSTLWGHRTLGGSRMLRGPRFLGGSRTLGGHRTLRGYRILWWPRKDAGTYKLAKVSWFPHHVFNLVEFKIKGRFICHCLMQINLTFFVKLKVC